MKDYMDEYRYIFAKPARRDDIEYKINNHKVYTHHSANMSMKPNRWVEILPLLAYPSHFYKHRYL